MKLIKQVLCFAIVYSVFAPAVGGTLAAENGVADKNGDTKTLYEGKPEIPASRPQVSKADSVVVSKPDISRSLIQLTSGLVAVLILIAVAAWFTRRFTHFHSTAGGEVRIIAGLALGARERLLVVQVADEQLLLGVAPGRVSTLHVLKHPIEANRSPATTGGDFLAKFKAALSKGP